MVCWTERQGEQSEHTSSGGRRDGDRPRGLRGRRPGVGAAAGRHRARGRARGRIGVRGRSGAGGPDVRQRPRAAVFSTNAADWYNGEVWVQAPFDSDNDGELDRIHADFSAPREVLTDGLKVPVVFEDSPYYAGFAPAYSNWVVDHELGMPPASRALAPFWAAFNTSPTISTRYESTWVPRGFAVVHAESPGTGHSDGCASSGASNETLAATAVIDWLNGRAPAYTTRTGDTRAEATWTTGKVGMIGTSYNGTIPEGAATTGVEGLEAIVPISAISDWYDYYRANGMVRAPHSSSNPTGNNNEFQGEDLDVLVDGVYSRLDEVGERTICKPADQVPRDAPGPRHGQPQRRRGRSATT